MALPSAPNDLLSAESLRHGVAVALTSHLAALRSAVTALDPAALVLAEQCELLLRGGKRLRAALAYWSFRAFGGAEGSPAAYQLGAALELFQASALFHDDLLDSSDTRRGNPTAHRALAARHLTSGYVGDPEKYGESAAILLGDLALSLAYEALDEAIGQGGLGADASILARTTFSQMCQDVIIGQYLDIALENEPLTDDINPQRAQTVLEAKSASYSVKYPLILGAIFAGVTDSRLSQLEIIGSKLGTAFQLRDDILGVFGDSMITGKPAGDDLVEGKRTVLLISALNSCTPKARETLIQAIGNQNLNPALLARAQEIITNSGARASVEQQINEFADDATALLTALPLANPGKTMLLELANALVARDA